MATQNGKTYRKVFIENIILISHTMPRFVTDKERRKTMVKIWGSAEALQLLPGDCNLKKYKCIRVYMKPDNGIAAVFMSNDANPPYYYVVDGSEEMYYKTRAEAINYCIGKGYAEKTER